MIRRAGFSAILFGFFLASGIATAQASRTWVSGVGDDANPCSRTAPCKTFAGAISKTAANGEIDALDPAGFGAVTITKAITIDGGGGINAGILAAGSNGIIINAGVNDVVTIRNLQIEGFATGLAGISFLAGGALHVKNVGIRNFTGMGIDFKPSTGLSRKLFVSQSTVQKSAGGIKVAPTGSATVIATIEDTLLNGNATFGLRVEGDSSAMAKNVTADGNLNGFYVTDTNGALPVMNLESCVAAHNSTSGIRAGFGAAGLAKAVMSNTQVFENATGLARDGFGQILSYGNNKVSGNGTDGTVSGPVPQI